MSGHASRLSVSDGQGFDSRSLRGRGSAPSLTHWAVLSHVTAVSETLSGLGLIDLGVPD